jgi:hypothetical protein
MRDLDGKEVGGSQMEAREKKIMHLDDSHVEM